MKKEYISHEKEIVMLSDMVQDVLKKWEKRTDAIEKDIEVNAIPMVLKHVLASHYVHFFKTDKDTVERYLDVLRKMIQEYKVDDLNKEFDVYSNENEAQA